MKLPDLTRKQWILASIVLLLLITNPSTQAFKDHVGDRAKYGVNRICNLFVCGVYKNFGAIYIAILGNFIRIQ